MTAKLNRTPGSVFVKVNPPKAGHVVNARRQDWKLIAHEMIADATAPVRNPSVEKQISTPAPPKQSLQSLLKEVDAIMQPADRTNTEPGTRGNHYIEPSGNQTKANPDSELMAYWDRKRVEKSDAYMARKRTVC